MCENFSESRGKIVCFGLCGSGGGGDQFLTHGVVKTGPGNQHVSLYRVLTWIRNQQDYPVPNPHNLYAQGLLGLGTSLKRFYMSPKCHFGEFFD